MIFTKASEYGIKAAVYIAQQSIGNKRVGLKTIAKEIDSPEAFTAKILQTLVKDRIIKSIQGPKEKLIKLKKHQRIEELILGYLK